MSSPATMSLLAGLVKGYTEKRASDAQDVLASRASTQQHMLAYLKEMASNPNVPAEHQQWAMQQGLALAQHDVTKPFPKGLADLTTLPPVNLQKPPQQAISQTPAMTVPGMAPVTPPQPPGGVQAQPSASPVGRSTNGTVNALGQMRNVMAPQPPPNLAVTGSPNVTLPAGSPSAIQNPQPPEQLAPGGVPHILSLSEKARIASSAEQEEINRLQQQYPDKSREDLAYMAQHGEFRPDEFTLTPGEKRFRGDQVIAENKEPKPGAKSGFEPLMGPAGPIGIKDVATGGMLTPQEVMADPHAKAVWDQATTEHKAQLTEQEAKEARHDASQAAQQARAFAQQINLLEARQETLTGTTKTMVETAPKVAQLAARVRKDMEAVNQGPLASRWQDFWAGKVGEANPEFTRLKTDAGLLQTLLMRMHVGARGGEYMMSHFKDMLGAGKQSAENMTAALDSIDSYTQDVKAEGEQAKAAVSEKARGGVKGGGKGKVTPPTPPADTTSNKEIHYKIVNGQLVPQ